MRPWRRPSTENPACPGSSHGADGAAEYVLVDVGGFLGIGTRRVAIGFDETTVLRDAGWDEL
jgi:hypothetical protein